MDHRIEIFAILGSLFLSGIIFELIRKKKLMEKYALLWFGSAILMIVISLWRDLLVKLANFMGVHYAPSALFLVIIFCGLILFLHFTIVISRLTEENKTLAQDVALLRERVERLSASEEPG